MALKNEPSAKLLDMEKLSIPDTLPGMVEDAPEEVEKDHPLLQRQMSDRSSSLPSALLSPRTMNMLSDCKETASINRGRNNGKKYLNQYLVLETLGKGSYGKVKKIMDTEAGTFFAVKIVDKKMLRKKRIGQFGNALQNVQREIAIWKALKHVNIVALFEVIDSADSLLLYMVSELVEGGPVVGDDIKCTALSEEKCKDYFWQLIDGLAFLHFHKTIHRDIKPANLLLSKDNVLKIADFGVSYTYEGDDDTMRQTAGTGPFLAPEMLTGNDFRGKPIDIWAAGITLYMFVYGKPPFIAQSIPQLYELIQNADIEYPNHSNGQPVNPDILDLLKNTLNRDPQARFTAAQLQSHKWLKSKRESVPVVEYQPILIEDKELSEAITPLGFYGMIAARKFASFIRNKHQTVSEAVETAR